MNPNNQTKSSPTQSSRPSSLMVNLAGVITITMWGLSFISSKVLLDAGMGPVEIYIYRFTLAYLLILIISHSRFRSHSWRDEAFCAMRSDSRVDLLHSREYGPRIHPCPECLAADVAVTAHHGAPCRRYVRQRAAGTRSRHR